MSDYMPPEMHAIMDGQNNGRLPESANEVVKFGSVVMTNLDVEPLALGSDALYQLLVAVAMFVDENFDWRGTRDLPQRP